MTSVDEFCAARDLLLHHRTDYDAARAEFIWPRLDEFNWALDWFDGVLAAGSAGGREALRVVDEDGTVESRTFADLAAQSNRVANWLRSLGVDRGDHVLIMLGNVVPLWEVMLACIKLGAVMIPATTLLTGDDLADRLDRGAAKAVVAPGELADRFDSGSERVLIAVGDNTPSGWHDYADASEAPNMFTPDGPTAGDDTLLLYFTSGTTSKPKLVEHTHTSYPVGHLSTMYWIGLQPADVHLNISSAGWAKHAWSNVFAPWNAEACVLVLNYARFEAAALLDVIVKHGVTTLCAPPTVWRMLVQADLGQWDVPLREVVGAGEPLNPEVIETVAKAWRLTIRDGFGQTETTALVGNSPEQPVKLGSMGRPLPGYDVVLLDGGGAVRPEGELCLRLDPRPVGLMVGYRDDPDRTAEAMQHGAYHTGDVVARDDDGYITYVGRSDDVFKASDYRISPFELESVLIEHDAVAEAAVVPSPDPVRLAVPKAFVALVAGREPSAELAREILRFCGERLSPFKRIRRLEFAELPNTMSGKIRRVELRAAEARHVEAGDGRNPNEFWEDDFPMLDG
ncbi:MAG: AMP-binding protein [Acidimicrobiales bacterium]